MRRIVLLVVLTAVITAMLALSASPAMAFIHTTLPAGFCAANPEAAPFEAADNELAEAMIKEHNPAKGPGLTQTGVIVDVPAESTAPCHH